MKKTIVGGLFVGAGLLSGLGAGTAQADHDLFTYRAMEERMCGYLDSRPTLQPFSNLSYGGAGSRMATRTRGPHGAPGRS